MRPGVIHEIFCGATLITDFPLVFAETGSRGAGRNI